LTATLSDYVQDKDEITVLIDNLDRGWPTAGATKEDILILRTFLESTKKLQRILERKDVNFHCLVFIRNDIYELLVDQTPDKDKDTPILLDWSDSELFKSLLQRRIAASGALQAEFASFEQMWEAIFSRFIGTEDAFRYILDRTLKRPRDFLNFIHRSIEVAINRRHEKVLEPDFLQAEKYYSDDLLKSVNFELKGVFPDSTDLLYCFLGSPATMTYEDATTRIRSSILDAALVDRALTLLLWYGFLGVATDTTLENVRYSFDVRYDMEKLRFPLRTSAGRLRIHPAFHESLGCQS
jgi:hypothetical protein